MTSQSFLQLNTIFISILIESLPFVLIGSLIAGFIQIFVKEEMIVKVLPKNRFTAVLFAALLGALFPACECGIIPIVRKLLLKGVPLYAGIAFMLTGPIINPIVIFSTYVAFGNQWDMVLYRSGLSFLIAVLIGILLSYQYKDNQLLDKGSTHHHDHHPFEKQSFFSRIISMLRHAVDEFFSVGKYLILGAFVAASMQTYIQTSTLLEIGQTKLTSSLVMMGLAFVLSLCSEADAFIASSFRSTFSEGSLVAFLLFGPMVDIKNTFMMLSAFKKRFVFTLIGYITLFVLLVSLLV